MKATKTKFKPKKTAKKRFKVTGNGKIMRLSTGHNHFMEKKDSTRKSLKIRQVEVDKADYKRIKAIIG
jgi:large subunit ribosomal protein L35